MSTALDPATAAQLHHAVDGICRRLGIDSRHATLIKYTMSAVFLVSPYVLRINRGRYAAELAGRIVAAAEALAQADAPTVRLADGLGPQPVASGDWVATIWRYTPTVDAEPKPVDLAAPLRAIHALGHLDAALPAWTPVEKFRRRLDATEALPPSAADDLDAWSRAQLRLGSGDLLRLLRQRCDDLADELARVRWYLPAGLIHGDAHTGNLLLRRLPDRPDPTAMLCDLDGVCHGPREWDLAPTAHGVARFGRSQTDYQAFVDRYGFDVTAWPGWPVLREVRELQLVTSTIGSLTGRPDVARQLAHRLRSLLAGDTTAVWTRYR